MFMAGTKDYLAEEEPTPAQNAIKVQQTNSELAAKKGGESNGWS